MKVLMLRDKICLFRVYRPIQRSSEKPEPQKMKGNILIHAKWGFISCIEGLYSNFPIFQKAPRYLNVLYSALIPLRLILLYPDENSSSLLISQ